MIPVRLILFIIWRIWMLPTVFCNLTILCMTHSKCWPLSWTEYNWWQSASISISFQFFSCVADIGHFFQSPLFYKIWKTVFKQRPTSCCIGLLSKNMKVTMLESLCEYWKVTEGLKVVGFHCNIVEVLALIWLWIPEFQVVCARSIPVVSAVTSWSSTYITMVEIRTLATVCSLLFCQSFENL